MFPLKLASMVDSAKLKVATIINYSHRLSCENRNSKREADQDLQKDTDEWTENKTEVDMKNCMRTYEKIGKMKLLSWMSIAINLNRNYSNTSKHLSRGKFVEHISKNYMPKPSKEKRTIKVPRAIVTKES